VNPVEAERLKRLEPRIVKSEFRIDPKTSGKIPENYLEPKQAGGAMVDFMETAKSSGALAHRDILLLSTWGFVIGIVSFIFLYAGWWLDERFDTAPTFMLGLLLLGVSLCVWRLYEDAQRRRAKRIPTTSLPLSP
jgi:F0F1-type ATP synthase assembly protein I